MDSPTACSRYITQNSKKRVFLSGSSSSGCKEVEVVEISPPPPTSRSSKPKSSKQKEVICHEIIDVDMEEDCDDPSLTDREVDRSAKGKKVLSNTSAGISSLAKEESGNDILTSNDAAGGLHDSTNVDDFSPNLFYGEDEWIDTYYDDIIYDDADILESHFDHMEIPPGVEAPFPWLPNSAENDTMLPMGSTSAYPSMQLQSDGIGVSPGLNSSHSPWSSKTKDLSASWSNSVTGIQMNVGNQHMNGKLHPKLWEPGLGPKTSSTSSNAAFMNYQSSRSSSTYKSGTSLPTRAGQRNVDEIQHKFNHFKKFDTVEDYSDHHYSKNGSVKEPPKNWAKRIQEEWKILKNDLPDEIFVRVYESRMDLLRAVIIGAEGTPYHDGLFFFDVFFPSSYPNVPPHVHYHSGGLRINPNLYNCGKVCLSLLNTWSGSQKEKWIPGVSTMLQVLVSIQGLILNAKPYFNEPGYENSSGTKVGEKRSLDYNERTFMHSLQTMVYTMRRPPKYFEDFVVGHFCKHACDILISCKAYLDGAQVGCLVKGGVQDVDEGDKSCSQHFKINLARFITTLVNTFTEIGAKDCQEFLSLAQKENGLASGPKALKLFN